MYLLRFAAIMSLLVSLPAAAQEARPAPPSPKPVQSAAAFGAFRTFGETAPPAGYVNFCRLQPGECETKNPSLERLILTPQRWAELSAINERVNTMIKPASDEELYGMQEHWTYPVNQGDCEDYVLLKRRMLLEKGWPDSALLITVVRDEAGEGHAVLTARTSGGNFILDNKQSKILSPAQTPYEFIKRQSFRSPAVWVSLTPTGSNVLRAAGAKAARK